MKKKEIWIDIAGCDGIYQVSNFGRVRKTMLLKGRPTRGGYLRVSIKHHDYYIHRLVAEYFIDNSHNKPTVNHKDGDRRNNSVNNLEWATYSENNQHSINVLGKKGPNRKKVRCVETGQEYNSITEAANDKRIPICCISAVLHGRANSAGGLRWKVV